MLSNPSKAPTTKKTPAITSPVKPFKPCGNFSNRISGLGEIREKIEKETNKEFYQALEKGELEFKQIDEADTEIRVDFLTKTETLLKQTIKELSEKNKKFSQQPMNKLRDKIIERVNLEIQLEIENTQAKIQKSGKEYIKSLKDKKDITAQIIEDNLAGIKLQVETAIKNIQKTSNAYKTLANWNCNNVNKVEDLERLNMMPSFVEFLKKQKS